MPIEPKKAVEIAALVEEITRPAVSGDGVVLGFPEAGTPDCCSYHRGKFDEMRKALVALWSEREELLSTITRLEDTKPAWRCADCGRECSEGCAGLHRLRRPDPEEMLALLRDVEWGGTRATDYDEFEPCCPACDGLKPNPEARRTNPGTGQPYLFGHAPDCRIAAFLR